MEGYEETWMDNEQYIVLAMYIHQHEFKKIESIGQLTRYISPGYGAHGVMEGYEER